MISKGNAIFFDIRNQLSSLEEDQKVTLLINREAEEELETFAGKQWLRDLNHVSKGSIGNIQQVECSSSFYYDLC